MVSLGSRIYFHYHLRHRPPERSSHILSDCSLALYSSESTPSFKFPRTSSPSPSRIRLIFPRQSLRSPLSNSSLALRRHPLRIFTSTSVAKHQSVLPIFSLSVVSTWSYRARLFHIVSIASGYCVVLLPWDFMLFFCSVLWCHSLANSG